MLKKYAFLLALIPVFAAAQAPSGYYSSAENLAGFALKSELHKIISERVYSLNYDDLKITVNQTDLDKYYENDGTILDIYSEKPAGPDAYSYTSANLIGSANAEGLGWNREHIMPQNTFYSAYPMYSDLFFVVPTDARINQLRSNYPYGKGGTTVYHSFTNGSKILSNATPNATYTGRVFEPIDEFKGDVARSLLYFAVRYEGKLGAFNFTTNANDLTKDQNPLDGTEEKAYDNWYIAMLLNWHQQDPVSQREIDRNNAVYLLQKNRNPFIDRPDWVGAIWNQMPDTVAPTAPSSLVLERNSAYFVTLKWQANPEADVVGYRIYQDNILVATSKTNTVSVDHLTPATTYNFTVKAYDSGNLESPQSNTIAITTLEADVFAKDLQIVRYLEGSGNNKAFEVANRTGHTVNLDRYRFGIQFKGSNYFFGEPSELEGEIENNQSFVIMNPAANFSCLDISVAKFVTNAPALTFSGTQYLELSYKATTIDAVGIKDQDNTNADKSLYRKSSIIHPNAAFDLSEWTAYASDYCLNLGNLSITDITNKSFEFNIYPNPVTEVVNISGDVGKAKSAKIYDVAGKLIKAIDNPFVSQKSINISSLSSGIYILNIDGRSIKFIKK